MAAWRSLFYAPAECRINGKYGANWRFLRREAPPESLSLSLSLFLSLSSPITGAAERRFLEPDDKIDRGRDDRAPRRGVVCLHYRRGPEGPSLNRLH